MSTYSQFVGCNYPTPSPQVLVSIEGPSRPAGAGGPGSHTGSAGDRVSPCYGSNNNSGTGSVCCEDRRPLASEPVTAQSVCSCQYDSARLAALSTYPRLTTSATVYDTHYPSTDQNPYPSIDSSSFYSTLNNPYGIKDGTNGAEMAAWTSASLQTTPGYYTYDPAMAAYGYGSSYDLSARRKNATRESTTTLKAWLNEHKKNPYPTKGEKIMLAIITKMTLTQVSTWFANARRRLKKENKMTWEPKNKTDDDDDDDEDDAALSHCDDKDKDDNSVEEDRLKDRRIPNDGQIHVKQENGAAIKETDEEDNFDDEEEEEEEDERNLINMLGSHYNHHHHNHHRHHQQQRHMQQQHHHHHHHLQFMKEHIAKPLTLDSVDCGIPLQASKPKIWSLADTAASKTPPPLHMQQKSTWCTSVLAAPTIPTYMNNVVRNGFISHSSTAYQSRYGTYYGGGSGAGGQSAGFPDVQTDTPPQTPPNMKLPSVSGNLMNCSANSLPFTSNNSHVSSSILNDYAPSQNHLHQQPSSHYNNCYNQQPRQLTSSSPQKDKHKMNINFIQQQQQQLHGYMGLASLPNNSTHSPIDDAALKPVTKNVNTEAMSGAFTVAV